MAAFHCNMCGACCTNMGADQSVLLLRQDIEDIARSRRMTPHEVRHNFCEVNPSLSERATVTILQLKSAKGRCIFLDDANKCAVHDYKPTQCRIGPDRFLPNDMRQDYECMTGVDPADDDQTLQFFSQLMEG